MLLLVDWGNTRIKSILVESLCSPQINVQLAVFAEDLTDWLTQLIPTLANLSLTEIYIASVRSETDNCFLLESLQSYCNQITFAKTQYISCGVQSAYAKPQTLGIDRWLGILAADSWAIHKGIDSVAVISIGSAITLDLLKNHQHIGGQIIPGRRLLLDSLSVTGQVRPESTETVGSDKVQLGTTTGECVSFGLDSLIEAYLVKALTDLNTEYAVRHFLMVGGGSLSWSNRLSHLGFEIEATPNLVFQGLARNFTKD